MVIFAVGLIALLVLLLVAAVADDYRSPQHQLARLRSDLRWHAAQTELRTRMAEQAIQRNLDWVRRGLE